MNPVEPDNLEVQSLTLRTTGREKSDWQSASEVITGVLTCFAVYVKLPLLLPFLRWVLAGPGFSAQCEIETQTLIS